MATQCPQAVQFCGSIASGPFSPITKTLGGHRSIQIPHLTHFSGFTLINSIYIHSSHKLSPYFKGFLTIPSKSFLSHLRFFLLITFYCNILDRNPFFSWTATISNNIFLHNKLSLFFNL